MLLAFLASRFDVWRRRSTTPTDARPSCRVFFYVVTAAPSFPIAPARRRPWLHAVPKGGCRGMIAANFLHRKGLRFVLSRRNAENHSCFRVGIGFQFVLSSRNCRSPFVLSSRNSRPNSCFRVGIARPCESPQPAHASAGSSSASVRAGARRVTITRALAGRRPTLRSSPSAGGGAGASSIRRMS